MKSAYEIAMERLRAESGPERKLTDAQRKRIAEIENKFSAKIAETNLNFDRRIAAAKSTEREAIQKQRVDELAGVQSRREAEKEAVWNEAAP
jgi:hypothetical protein